VRYDVTQSESVQVFLRFLHQRYEEFKIQLDNMLKTMSSNDREAKLSSSRQFLTSGSGLALTLAASDRPDWLKELIDNTEWYIGNHEKYDANHTHVMQIIARYDQAMNHEWSFRQLDNSDDYSFDDLYEHYRKDSKIQELNDAMVETLNFMIDSCEIDSVSAISSLNQLILLIEQNSSGSYSAILATHEFITRFMRNSTWMQIRKIPGVKTFKDSFEKTTKDIDTELDKLHKEIVNELQERYDVAIKPIAQKNHHRNTLLETAVEI